MMFADKNPALFPIISQHVKLLESATSNGLLHGGMHYTDIGAEPCVHHTFCHAKSASYLLDDTNLFEKELIPENDVKSRSSLPAVMRPKDAEIWLINRGDFRVTITNYDWVYGKGITPSGGTLTLLFNRDTGPLIASGMNENVTPETANMQAFIGLDFEPVMPRVELIENGKRYHSANCLSASASIQDGEHETRLVFSGNVVDSDQRGPVKNSSYEYVYNISDTDGIHIQVECSDDLAARGALFYLPIIQSNQDKITQTDRNTLQIGRGTKTLEIVSSEGFEHVPELKPVFNYSPGFKVLPFHFPMQRKTPMILDLKIK